MHQVKLVEIKLRELVRMFQKFQITQEEKESDWFKKGRLFDFSSAETLQDVGLVVDTDVIYHGSNAPPEKIKKEGLKTTPNYFKLSDEETIRARPRTVRN